VQWCPKEKVQPLAWVPEMMNRRRKISARREEMKMKKLYL
jgi:hypothetical protein